MEAKYCPDGKLCVYKDACTGVDCREIIDDPLDKGDSLKTEVEEKLIAVLNHYAEHRELHPQTAAEILLGMIPEILSCLSWKPRNVVSALGHIDKAVRDLGG